MKKVYEDIKKVFESKVLVGFLYSIGVVIVVILIFSAGVSVGFHKASFGRAWGENYERNFGIRPDRMMFGDDNLPNPHGVMGKIIKIELPAIITESDGETEKTVLVNKDTKIKRMRNEISSADLKADDFIVVIGNPNNQGQIEAKLIRVIPSPKLISNSQNPTENNNQPTQ